MKKRPLVGPVGLLALGGLLFGCTSLAESRSPGGVQPAAPQTPQVASASPVQTATLARIRQLMEKEKVPGVGYAVVLGNRVLFTGGEGFADVDRKRPATDRTVWRLASISKTFTAVAALRLWERGRLDLDAPVQKYVGDRFPDKEWPLTTRQLLGHLGGVRHYRNREAYNATHYRNVLDPLAIFSGDPLAHEPGTKYLYSTYGFNLVGAVVERASGQPFVEFVTATVFRPAGMRETGMDDVTRPSPELATGYNERLTGLQTAAWFDASNKVPGGGFVSTAPDMARFAIAMMSDDKLVKNATRKLMWTEGKTPDGKGTGYGLGWGVTSYLRERVVAHSGGQPGVSTLLWMLPEKRFAVILLTNKEDVRLSDTARVITDVVLKSPAQAVPAR